MTKQNVNLEGSFPRLVMEKPQESREIWALVYEPGRYVGLSLRNRVNDMVYFPAAHPLAARVKELLRRPKQEGLFRLRARYARGMKEHPVEFVAIEEILEVSPE